MIPKIIHYCWFGSEKPKKVQECIASWQKVLPEYEIIEWNIENFDIEEMQYTKDAYAAKKYAFVSDVARVKALYEYGGIYLDTDVMVYKKFDPILGYKGVLGFEEQNFIATSFMACEKGHKLFEEFYDRYKELSFYDKEGNMISGTNVEKLTRLLEERGLQRNNCFQAIGEDIVIFPQEYFSPYDYSNCIHQNTRNTICEHLFFVSWLPWQIHLRKKIKFVLVRIIGKKGLESIRILRKRITTE